jgi:laccase
VQGTKVKVLNYGEAVEIVFQGTNVLTGAMNHPMHLHGYSFYVVGIGSNNFDNETDPKGFNLVDPPEVNTFSVPTKGWLAIRFLANNPGISKYSGCYCRFPFSFSFLFLKNPLI